MCRHLEPSIRSAGESTPQADIGQPLDRCFSELQGSRSREGDALSGRAAPALAGGEFTRSGNFATPPTWPRPAVCALTVRPKARLIAAMKDKTILVTGATGTTGKLVVRELAKLAGVRVRAAARSVEKARAVLPDVEVVSMDYARPETVEKAVSGAHAVYLITPGGSGQIEQTWVTVQAARAARVERIVKLGSLDAPRGPRTQVERWCQMSEDMVRGSGAEFVFLRPTWFDQNFTELYFAPTVKRGFVAAPMGEGRAGWIDCRDIAAVAAKVLTEDGHAGKAYTLTGPALIGIGEIVDHLSRVAGRTIRYVDTPEWVQRFLSKLAGFPARDIAAMAELIGKLRDGWLTDVTDDVAAILGRPPISFDQFAADHASMLR